MKKYISAILAALFVVTMLPLALVGCANEKTLNILNWGDYLDKDVKNEFKKRTGITIKETNVTSNEDMLIKLEQEDCPFDLCTPSDYAIERLIKGGWLAEINYDNIPNIVNIDEYYRNLPFDPDNKYSVPYTWGVLGVLYNKTMVDEADLGSWDILWNEKYSGQIFMYDSIRDTMAVALGYCGYSINSTDPDELKAAADALIAQRPLVKAWCTDDIKDNMIDGTGALAVVYSGDAVWCTEPEEGNTDLDFFCPEGSNLYFDSMVIPKNSKKKDMAEQFINFLLEPEIAARNTEYIGYSTPNKEVIPLLGEDWENNHIFNIPHEELATLEIFRDLGDDIKLYEAEWDRVNIH
ncbi:MAG: spermidine/putrescine ABC transporter substrate-binding protein [Clostridiales bacterium]|nr:spermidine/putrescine ABC transporter substrate-binding protein [Clostridiales bacterium]